MKRVLILMAVVAVLFIGIFIIGSNKNVSAYGDIGPCIASCDAEQGMCISYCQGNGQCIGQCAAAHGRCVSRCR